MQRWEKTWGPFFLGWHVRSISRLRIWTGFLFGDGPPAPPCFAHFWRPGSLEAMCFKHTKVRSLIAPISLELMFKTCVDEEYATQVVLPSRGKMIPCIFRESQLEPVIKCWNSIFNMNFLLFSSPVYLFVPLRLSLFPYKRRAQQHQPTKIGRPVTRSWSVSSSQWGQNKTWVNTKRGRAKEQIR